MGVEMEIEMEMGMRISMEMEMAGVHHVRRAFSDRWAVLLFIVMVPFVTGFCCKGVWSKYVARIHL